MCPSALLLAVLLSQTASPPLPTNPEVKAKAQALLREGSAMFEQGDYQAALDKFEAAYAIFPSPKLQFNIAQANRDLGRPVEALKAYESFLALAPDASPDTLGDARRSVVDLHGKLGQLKIAYWPADSEVTLDGKNVGPAASRESIWAVPGYHQVTIQRQQFSPAIENVEVLAGKVQTLTVKLRPIAASPQASPAPTSTEPPSGTQVQLTKSPDGETGSHRPYGTYALVGAGTIGALVLGAIVAGLVADSRFTSLQNSCGHTPGGCSESQIDTLKSRVLITNILWGLAGGAAIATGISFYLDHRETGVSIARRF